MTSTAMILPAPTRRAAWIVLSPTPPQPNTATLAPGGTLAPLSDSRLLGGNDTVQATRARGGRDALRPADQGRDGRRRDGLRALSRRRGGEGRQDRGDRPHPGRRREGHRRRRAVRGAGNHRSAHPL